MKRFLEDFGKVNNLGNNWLSALNITSSNWSLIQKIGICIRVSVKKIQNIEVSYATL